MSPIIGYFHICQVGNWRKSFHMIMESIMQSGLYDAANEIRCGVLTEFGEYDQMIHSYEKIQIVYLGTPAEYERPTLLHMREAENTDPVHTKYFYIHTKGIRWFDTPQEPFVIDWINLLLYWNIEQWRDAEDTLNKYDTYGCNYYNGDKYPVHYSGNFFWTTRQHINTLPRTIGNGYNDPEFWICSAGNVGNRPNSYNVFSSNLEGMGHYAEPFPKHLYKK